MTILIKKGEKKFFIQTCLEGTPNELIFLSRQDGEGLGLNRETEELFYDHIDKFFREHI